MAPAGPRGGGSGQVLEFFPADTTAAAVDSGIEYYSDAVEVTRFKSLLVTAFLTAETGGSNINVAVHKSMDLLTWSDACTPFSLSAGVGTEQEVADFGRYIRVRVNGIRVAGEGTVTFWVRGVGRER